MKHIVTILALCLLSACEMSYEEVVAAEKYCTDRGMTATRAKGYANSNFVNRVYCKDDKGSVFSVKGK